MIAFSAALFAAARVSEDLTKTGGYHPDRAGMWARLLEGDKAMALQTRFPTNCETPFGGFAEMLLQSQTGALHLLPALPDAAATIRSLGGSTPRVEVEGKLVALGRDFRITLQISRDEK